MNFCKSIILKRLLLKILLWLKAQSWQKANISSKISEGTVKKIAKIKKYFASAVTLLFFIFSYTFTCMIALFFITLFVYLHN